MKRIIWRLFHMIILLQIYSCKNNSENAAIRKKSMEENIKPGNFIDDLHFLKKYQDVILLSANDDQSQLIICPGWQARVMTSTAEGLNGISFGWINYELIKTEKYQPHINVFGGEDRFWLGPEGGQYSIFFKKGSPFDLHHWQTPSVIDTERFNISEVHKDRAGFVKQMEVENYSGTIFNLLVERKIQLLNKEEVKKILQTDPGTLKAVAFQSKNIITNTGQNHQVYYQYGSLVCSLHQKILMLLFLIKVKLKKNCQ